MSTASSSRCGTANLIHADTTANYVELLEDDAADLATVDEVPEPPLAPPPPPMPGRSAALAEPEPEPEAARGLTAHALYAYTKDEANECVQGSYFALTCLESRSMRAS